MEIADVIALAHPAIAVALVFPILGTVVNAAWQTRHWRQKQMVCISAIKVLGEQRRLIILLG